MARLVWIFAVWIFLAGCTGPTPIRGTGEPAPAPAGWEDFCKRHPEDLSCFQGKPR